MFKVFSASFALLFISFYPAQSQTLCGRASQTIDVLNEYHTNPRKIDESFATDLHRQFYTSFDPLRLFFTAEDFKSDSIRITTTLLESKSICNWVNLAEGAYLKKLKAVEKIIHSILAKPLPFNEDIYLDLKSFQRDDFCQNQKELSKRWQRWLSLEALTLMKEKALAAGDKKLDAKLLKPPLERPSKIWAAAGNYKRGTTGLGDARGRGSAAKLRRKSFSKIFS